MTSITRRILLGLAALLAVAGFASAQSACPECDDDGAGNEHNTYSSIDLGAVENSTRSEVLADSDVAHGHLDDDKGFWAWLSLCFHAFLGKVEDALGIDLGVDANVEAYVSEDGIDLDAVAYVGDERIDFEETPLADLDGATWKVMGNVSEAREDVVGDYPVTIPDYGGVDADVCVYADLGIAGC